MLFFMDGGLKIMVNTFAIVVEIHFRTEEARDNHINKGCYVRETGQFKLSNVNEYFDSQKCCPRNPFAIYGDTETEMRKRIEQWDLMMIGMKFTFHKQ